MYHNVLPQEVKDDLRSEYRKRLMSAVLFVTATAFFVAALALVPVLVLVISKEKHGLSEQEALTALKASGESTDSTKRIEETRAKLALLEKDEAPIQPTALIAKIVEAKPTGLTISAIRYDRGASGGPTITIDGTAGTRAQLVAFQENLEKTAPFTKITLPISTLAKSAAAPFTLTVVGDF